MAHIFLCIDHPDHGHDDIAGQGGIGRAQALHPGDQQQIQHYVAHSRRNGRYHGHDIVFDHRIECAEIGRIAAIDCRRQQNGQQKTALIKLLLQDNAAQHVRCQRHHRRQAQHKGGEACEYFGIERVPILAAALLDRRILPGLLEYSGEGGQDRRQLAGRRINAADGVTDHILQHVAV